MNNYSKIAIKIIMQKHPTQLKFICIFFFCFSFFYTEAQIEISDKKKYIRLSADMQLYGPSPLKYDFPIASIDSFSVSGSRATLTYQFGITAEIINPNRDNWAFVFSIGVGSNEIGHRFKASADFTKYGEAISSGLSGGPVSFYLLPSIGLAYKHPIGKKFLQHSIVTTFQIPFLRDGSTTARWESQDLSSVNVLDFDFSNAILVERSFFGSQTNQLLGGLEYRPEVLFGLNKRFFWALGFVFNYSLGTLVQGDVTVKNNHTTYEGTFVQGFSKTGISVRFGFNSNYKKK